jgi:tetratricopeptide (TPR) repeat protein
MHRSALGVFLFLAICAPVTAQEHTGEHPVPEKLGRVSFPTTCKPGVQAKFERAVALLHSFAYSAAEKAFEDVAKEDPNCAMAGWGQAMANFHQIWEPAISPAGLERGRAALKQEQESSRMSVREREYIAALAPVFQDAGTVPYDKRLHVYEQAIGAVAAHYPQDPEARIFYALALLATAPPDDKTHRNQKQAADLLEPLYRQYPEHPGVVHYLIHAYDNAEMAPRGVEVARVYAQIAPSAPHALHMPSHIFTRLGMWSDSIQSNLAARAAAHQQGDTGEELHAMDYLVYAYLQSGKDAEAAAVLAQLRAISSLEARSFKVGYAATAMPVRYAVERRQWAEAAQCRPAEGSLPWVAAIAVWARAVGFSRGGNAVAGRVELAALESLREKSLALGDSYWAEQVRIQVLEASAWMFQASSKPAEAAAALREAADAEDGIEKRPVTPGPITPAREQLADLLLEQGHAREALTEYESALRTSPGRRGALTGALEAAIQTGDQDKIRLFSGALHSQAE